MMEKIPSEINYKIFIMIRGPISLMLTSRSWWIVSITPVVHARWLCFHFEQAHALFHAIRFGSKFLNEELVSILLEMGIVPSRYFAQRLVRQYGKCDPLLTCLKVRRSTYMINQ